MKQILVIVVLLFSVLINAQNKDAFLEANDFYNNGEYQEAIARYEAILNTQTHSPELYFNLANSYYKLNQIAASIYFYERALQLSPDDIDILNNYSFAKNMTIDAIEELPEIGFTRVLKTLVNTFTVDSWAKLSVCCVILFVILFLSYYFSFSTSKKRASFVLSFITLILATAFLSFAFQKHAINKKNNPAIVFAQESDVKSDPNLKSETAFQLHEGTKVQVLETYNDSWTKIKIANGKNGWINSKDIRLLNDF